jgi:hypothetical protein
MVDDSDPRVSGDYVRRLPGSGDDGDVVVTGVVHEHPASAYRVRSVVEDTAPDVLALELPPIAIPLFERYADDPGTPPDAGGEMSAAIRAAPPATVVGIDGPTPAFLWRLAGDVYRSDAGWSTVRRLSRGLLSVTTEALACRLAATFGGPSGFRRGSNGPADDDCDWRDPPEAQAADEADRIRRAMSVQHVFGESGAVELRDGAREAHMADRLASLRREGTVVAVVGVDHLEPVADRLD